MKILVNAVIIAAIIIAAISFIPPMWGVYGIGAVLAFSGLTR